MGIFGLESIRIDEHTQDWKRAIEICGGLLVETGAATDQYTAAMVQAVENLGPYIVIVPHIAVAHAAAGLHVKRDGLVLTVFKEPVVFGSANDPVHIIIGICAVSTGSHLEQFKLFADILEDEQIYEEILSCNTETELCAYLNSITKS